MDKLVTVDEEAEFMAKLVKRYTGIPEVIVTTAEMYEAAVQREIGGILNNGDHTPLVVQLSTHRFLVKREDIRTAIGDGKFPFIVARMHKLTVPLYYKKRGWTFKIEEAIRFSTIEQVEYWSMKLGKKHVRGERVEFILPAIEGDYDRDAVIVKAAQGGK